MKKKLIPITILIIFLVLPTTKIFAQTTDEGRILEIDYPAVPGAQTPTTTKTLFPEYIQYIYYFAIGTGAVIALIILTIAGVEYMTSAGNPDKLSSAKDKIISCLLGLLILAASVPILNTINPRLTLLEIDEELASLISAVPTGVVLCQGSVPEVEDAWYLATLYYFENPGKAEKKAISEQIEKDLATISEKCYIHNESSDIRPDFDNKITTIWFVPSWHYSFEKEDWIWTEYGAVSYEETGFKGLSKAHTEHLEATASTGGYIVPYQTNIIGGASSVIPFKLITEPDSNWFVTVFKDFNYNDGIKEEDKKWYTHEFSGASGGRGGWVTEFEQGTGMWDDWFPKSMQTEGQVLTVLFTAEDKSESFFSQNVANLEAFDNIVKWEECEDYEGQEESIVINGQRVCAHSKVIKVYMMAAERM